jgi:hypothetical protein
MRNLTVSPFMDGISKRNTFLALTWELEANNDDLTNWKLEVLRSNSPDGPFDVISMDLFNENLYVDTTASVLSKNRVHYYKIRGTEVDTGKQVEIGPERLDDKIDLIGLEIIRRNNLLLKRFNGMPVGIFVRRTSGQRCNVCYDFTTSRTTKDNCKDCYGTGYDLGYYDQISTFMNFNPEPQVIQISGLIKTEDGDTQAWMSNFPVLSPGDVIVESTNKRWRVMDMVPTRKFRVIVHQVVNLRRLSPSDPEFMLPFEDPRGIITRRDEAMRREHTVVALSRYKPDDSVSVAI